jgi:hypothetical protein
MHSRSRHGVLVPVAGGGGELELIPATGQRAPRGTGRACASAIEAWRHRSRAGNACSSDVLTPGGIDSRI